MNQEILKAALSNKPMGKGNLIEEFAQRIQASASLMENALESDKPLIVAREAQKINDSVQSILVLLNDVR